MPDLNGPHYASHAYRKGTSEPQPEVEPEPEPEAEVEAEEEFVPQHVGGGMFELSNGERVRGKDAALKAQAKL